MDTISLEELMLKDALLSDDPVERHIIQRLQRLRQQNKRLKDHIEKTGAWADLKEIDLWKPFDFYHYFQTKYFDRYGVEYRHTGNLVLTYKKINEFRTGNHITRAKYKEFIGRAFKEYFNNINIPRVGHICSSRLYNYIMSEHDDTTAADLRALDNDLMHESEKFDAHVESFNRY